MMKKQNCSKAKLPSICSCFTERTELLTSEVTTLRTTSVTQSTELITHALTTETVTEKSSTIATETSTATLLTLVNFTSCSQLEGNNESGSRRITWPCGTQPAPALGSKRRDPAVEPSNNLTAIIAAAAAGGVVLIVAVVVTIYLTTCRSKNSIIQRDKYGRVQYPI
ncbi:uncharacterized protein LOC112567219 [Pomacea canaliculata]|uniref:uncharacterized protein LOC112567219 n=1 Tax=Pomacea canaliculata TaxID=400727 RepID=UPI000D73969D|nr:uncharacterized protein LOC112567219 [Pomacea canaliculata]